jgi:sulfatase maturation enzyme AslB (radical SAM superfamily)
MVKANMIRNKAVLFSSSKCNLQCRYCNIDKNPVLGLIDQVIEKSFQGDYYFNRIKDYFQDRGQLQSLDIWGGEPFLSMERIYPVLHQIIGYYPFFETFSVSTNFSFEGWVDRVLELAKQFGRYSYRDFSLNLQLSCDGYEEINDASRGIGVTARCIANFDNLLARLGNELPANVRLQFLIKQTLDRESIKMLQSEESIIKYYKFFEDNFLSKVYELGYSNVTTFPTIPNTAVPSPSTKEDGMDFAKLCRAAKNVSLNNTQLKYYRENLIPLFMPKITNLTCRHCSNLCGCASNSVGFLPDNMVSLCNESFTQMIDEYKKEASQSTRAKKATIEFDKFFEQGSNSLRVTDEEFVKMEKIVEFYNTNKSTSAIAGITTMIVTLAMAGQIDEKYQDIQQANLAANFFKQSNYCIKDCINITGSMTLMPVGLIRLVLNGALDIMWEDKEDGQRPVPKGKR